MPYGVLPVDTTRKPLFTPGMKVNWEHPINRGLVGCWIMNEGAGVLYDLVKGKASGTLPDSITWSGDSLVTSGTDDQYVNLGTGYLSSSLTQYSFACTYKQIGTRTSTHGFGGYMFNAGNHALFELVTGAANDLRVRVRGASAQILATKTAVTNGQFHNAVFTRDGTTVRLWVDGIEGTPATGTDPGSITTENGIYIGDNVYSSPLANAWKRLDVYDRVLADGEIMQLSFYPYGTPDNPRLI